jgi:hypothetical protein
MSSISLHVNFKERDFTIVKNSIIRDTSIKPTARILLIFLLGCDPERFSINTGSLAKSIGVGRSAITSASKELQDANYLVIERFSNGHVSWNVFECPIECVNIKNENPHTENQDVENPYVENQHALRRTNLKEEPIVKEEPIKDFVQQAEPIPILKTKACEEMAFKLIWSKYHKKESKADAERAFLKITSKLKTDEQVKEVTAHILNFNIYALSQLKKTNGKKYFGFDKKLLSTILNQKQYNDFSAEEIYNLVSGV